MPPVEVGQSVTKPIFAIGRRGDRIIKVRNYIIFVPSLKKEGEVTTALVTRVMAQHAFAVEI